MSKLARQIIAFDAEWPPETPGDTEQEVCMPGPAWARLVELARVELNSEDSRRHARWRGEANPPPVADPPAPRKGRAR